MYWLRAFDLRTNFSQLNLTYDWVGCRSQVIAGLATIPRNSPGTHYVIWPRQNALERRRHGVETSAATPSGAKSGRRCAWRTGRAALHQRAPVARIGRAQGARGAG